MAAFKSRPLADYSSLSNWCQPQPSVNPWARGGVGHCSGWTGGTGATTKSCTPCRWACFTGRSGRWRKMSCWLRVLLLSDQAQTGALYPASKRKQKSPQEWAGADQDQRGDKRKPPGGGSGHAESPEVLGPDVSLGKRRYVACDCVSKTVRPLTISQ